MQKKTHLRTKIRVRRPRRKFHVQNFTHASSRCTQNTHSVHDVQNSLFTITNMKCVLVAQGLTRSRIALCHFVRINESFIRSAMSSPHLCSSSPSQHEAPPGQHDLLRDDTACSTPRNFSMSSENNLVGKQRPVGKKRSKTTLSQKNESGGCAQILPQNNE